MESTLTGFFLAGFLLVYAGALSNWFASHKFFGGWRREFHKKAGPIFLRWGLRVWVAGIVFLLLGTVPVIAFPALVIWVVARIAKRKEAGGGLW